MKHGLSNHAKSCPTRTVERPLRRLNNWNAVPSISLASYPTNGTWRMIRSTEIIAALWTKVAKIGSKYGLAPADISARSLRASGAIALLLGNVDSNITKLISRWRSTKMMKYLHASA